MQISLSQSLNCIKHPGNGLAKIWQNREQLRFEHFINPVHVGFGGTRVELVHELLLHSVQVEQRSDMVDLEHSHRTGHLWHRQLQPVLGEYMLEDLERRTTSVVDCCSGPVEDNAPDFIHTSCLRSVN